MLARHRIRLVANVIGLSTSLGSAVAKAGGATVEGGPRGLLIATGYQLALPRAYAFTIGNVVVSRVATVNELPKELLDHEESHANQWAALTAPGFLAAYSAASLWSWVRTGDAYSRNAFERSAGLPSGGYRERPTVPLRRRFSGRLVDALSAPADETRATGAVA